MPIRPSDTGNPADPAQARRSLSTRAVKLMWQNPRLVRNRLKLLFLPNLPFALLKPYYLDLTHPFPQACNALWKGYRILPDGTASPCLHLVAGNIATQPFLEIWNGPQMRRFRQIISCRLFPGCARCCSRSFI
jgi:MoaA/NifB/PqqE/SkfB family radical SAM enzyme